MRNSYIILTFLLLLFSFNSAQAASLYWEEMTTKVRISVLAKDGMFIGTDMGGVYIEVRNKRTGDIMAEGISYGSKGDQDLIMGEERSRNAVLTDHNTASFDFSLTLFEPTPVTIKASGPLAQPQSMFTTTQDYILLPAKDYSEGNGIVLEMSGLVVDIISPAIHQVSQADPNKEITLLANVVKLSGNNIEDGSPWIPENYEVQAFIYVNGGLLKVIAMEYAGNSQFISKLYLPKPASYRAMVSAYDPKTKEAGVDYTTIIITAPEKSE